LAAISVTRPASPAVAASTACSHRSSGDCDILLAVDHKGHGRTRLKDARRNVKDLFAGIGAVGEQASIHTRKHQVPGGGKRTALIESGGAAGHAPPLLLRDGVPSDQEVSAPFRTN
jgi:hypothetical protein